MTFICLLLNLTYYLNLDKNCKKKILNLRYYHLVLRESRQYNIYRAVNYKQARNFLYSFFKKLIFIIDSLARTHPTKLFFTTTQFLLLKFHNGRRKHQLIKLISDI